MELNHKPDNIYTDYQKSSVDAKIIDLVLKQDLIVDKISSKMIVKNLLITVVGFIVNYFIENNTLLIVAIALGMMLYVFIDIFQQTSKIRNHCTDTILKLGIDEYHLEFLKDDPKLIDHGHNLLRLIISEMKLRKLK